MTEKKEYGWLPLSRATVRTGIPLSGIPGEPGRHCPMHTALALAKQLGDISTLVVGTAECGYYSRYVMTEPRGKNGELHYVYELDANEVVFGCRKGLMDAIGEMDREGTKLILLILTCVPALIGEDMKAVIDELDGKVRAKLFFIDGAHFKYNGYLTGFLDTYCQLGEVYNNTESQEFMLKTWLGQEICEADSGREDQEPIHKETGQVNFLGSLRGVEALALKNFLTEAGYGLLEMNPGNITGKLAKLWESSLSVLQDPYQGMLAKTLKKPVISLCRSFLADDIREDYRTLKKMLIPKGNTEEEFQFSSYKELKDREEKACRELRRIPFIITVQELLALPIAAYLAALGMEPKLLGVESFLEEDVLYRERILNEGYNPYLVTITEEKNLREWGKDYPLLSVGHSSAVPESRVINNLKVQKIFALLGYERSILLLDHLMELAEEMKKGGVADGLI